MSPIIPKSSGIYKITCLPTGKIYIGSAVNLCRRQIEHYSRLRQNRHGNQHLQNAWNKYGEDSFTFDVIELVLEPFLVEREQYWLDRTRAYRKSAGFNLSPTAGSSLGVQRSAEFRKKVSDFNKGRKQSPEHIARNAAARRGQKRKLRTASANNNFSAQARRAYIEKYAKTYIVTAPSGEEMIIKNLKAFCREHGLTDTGMYFVVYGKQTHHKGWKCRLLE